MCFCFQSTTALMLLLLLVIAKAETNCFSRMAKHCNATSPFIQMRSQYTCKGDTAYVAVHMLSFSPTSPLLQMPLSHSAAVEDSIIWIEKFEVKSMEASYYQYCFLSGFYFQKLTALKKPNSCSWRQILTQLYIQLNSPYFSLKTFAMSTGKCVMKIQIFLHITIERNWKRKRKPTSKGLTKITFPPPRIRQLQSLMGFWIGLK